MAKIVVECTDPNDLDAIEKASEQIVGKCDVTHYRTSEAMKESGAAASTYDSAKKIHKITGEPLGTVRYRIKKGKQEVDKVYQPDATPENNTEKEGTPDREEKPILCVGCQKNIAHRKMKNEKWYYWPGNLCKTCKAQRKADYKKRESASARKSYHTINLITTYLIYIKEELDKSLVENLPIKQAASANNQIFDIWYKVSEIINTKIIGG